MRRKRSPAITPADAEFAALRARLDEAEQTRDFRLVETMKEGAAVGAFEEAVVYANERLAEMLGSNIEHDVSTMVSALTAVIVPRFADWCALFTFGADGEETLELAGAAHADGERVALLRTEMTRIASGDHDPMIGAVLQTSTPRRIEVSAGASGEGAFSALGRALETRSFMVAPVRVQRRTCGVILAGKLQGAPPGADPTRGDADDVGVGFAEAFESSDELSGARLLVVDDDADGREIVAEVLRECQAEVRTADSADSAFSMLQNEPFDALVSDISMPGEDGYSLIGRVRTLPPERNGRILAVALTAFTRAEDRKRALVAGFNGHIPKPVDPQQLVLVLSKMIRQP